MVETLVRKVIAATPQLSRFATVGAMGAVVDFTVYLTLTRGFDFWRAHYLAANLLAFLVANVHNFLWHRQWTFAVTSRRLLVHYLQFLLTSVVYLAVIQSGLWLLTYYALWYDLIAKLVANGVAVVVYFTVLKLYIFRPPPKVEAMVEQVGKIE